VIETCRLDLPTWPLPGSEVWLTRWAPGSDGLRVVADYAPVRDESGRSRGVSGKVVSVRSDGLAVDVDWEAE
jgi:hypothetical protein